VKSELEKLNVEVVIAHLSIAYVKSGWPARKHIENAIIELVRIFKPVLDDYRKIVNGFIEAGVSFKYLVHISGFLPGEPKLVLIKGRTEGGFVFKEEEGVSTIIGLDDNGRFLVNTMIEMVAAKAKSGSKFEFLPEHF
jgi:hypothetical protein